MSFSLEEASNILLEIFSAHATEVEWASDVDVILQVRA